MTYLFEILRQISTAFISTMICYTQAINVYRRFNATDMTSSSNRYYNNVKYVGIWFEVGQPKQAHQEEST